MIGRAAMSPTHDQPLRRKQVVPAPPPVSTARHFYNREVGVLSEQGGHDRARMLLARQAQRESLNPEPYLDAIRLELGVPSSGSAWRAWLARAFESKAEIADRIATIVPEAALCMALIEISPGAIFEQADRPSALDLLRLRARALLASDDPRSLDLLETEAITSSSDAEIVELCLNVLSARAFAEPARVERLAAKLSTASTHEPLRAALAIARDYAALSLSARLPSPLERMIALLGRCDEPTDRNLLAAVDRDLRAQPVLYLEWADAVALAAPRLIDAWLTRWQTPVPAATPDGAAITAKVITEASAAIESDPLRFVPLPATELTLYRKHVRLKALSAIVEHAPSVRLELLRTGGAEQPGRVRRALNHLANDPALALVEQLARQARDGTRARIT